jgi:hypothetical protein
MSVAATVAALRLISVDSKTYHIFADIWWNLLYSFSNCNVTFTCFKCSHCWKNNIRIGIPCRRFY